ncbi:MAG: hypothetical protein ACYS3S_04770 [Planctomycetota bacterium]
MKTNGKSRLGILVAIVVLLFAALAVGIGIKQFQPQRVEVEPQVEEQGTRSAETRPQEETKLSKLTPEDEEFLQWLDEEIKKLEEESGTMLDQEHKYVSEEQAEVSSLKESMSREKLQAEFAAGRMSKKGLKTKAGDQGKKVKADSYLWDVWAELQAEVAAGRMSEEDAKAEMSAIKKSSAKAKPAGQTEKAKAGYQTEKAKAGYQTEKVNTNAYLK